MSRPVSAFLPALLTLAASAGVGLAVEPGDRTPLEVFEQRIMPIFKSPHPASCTQCHLASVGLKDYIRPSHEETFASLRDQGMIDLAEPKKSKILTLIDKGRDDPDKQARMIHERTRQAEYEAFEAWILACCNDPKLRGLPRLGTGKQAQPEVPVEVIRHARKSRVVDSFVRNVWSQRMRCFPCHTPHELDASNPNHRLAIQRHKGFMEQDDKAFAGRMNIFRESPEATLQYLIEESRAPAIGELPLINLKDPRKSLLVLKPTSKVPQQDEDGEFAPPTYSEPVSHMGGLKMHVDDQSYKAFIAWIQDYSRVVGGKYTSVAELPADNWHPSKHVILMKDVPEAWSDRARVQFFIHARSADGASWESKPAAFTQGSRTPRRTVAAVLFLIRTDGASDDKGASRSNPEYARLAPGGYLLKAYIDRKGRLSDDPTVLLGEADFFGQVEIQARWREGFPEAETISGKLLK